jgi:hypothetical protein
MSLGIRFATGFLITQIAINRPLPLFLALDPARYGQLSESAYSLKIRARYNDRYQPVISV